jgi:general nucleoside transport system ATP-binding protein
MIHPTAGALPTVEAKGLSKTFGSVKALDNASIRFSPGRLHALLGENGAGKSTLVKCMLGYYKADAGSLLIDAQQVTIAKPQDAHALGLGMVYQHFTLVQQMTVAENLVLARADVPMIIDWKAEHAALRDFMRRMPFELDPEYPVSSLAAGEKQKLEILKQLYLGRRFLVLDEPTSVLTPDEADEVLSEMRRLADAHELSVVLITHKFREVMGFAQDVTVLRNGQVIGTRKIEETTQDELGSMMFGAAPDSSVQVSRRESLTTEAYLVVEDLRVRGDRGTLAVDGATLRVGGGEIVGVAGISGNGQKQLVEVLAAQREMESGRVSVAGRPYNRTRREMQDRGVFVLTEEPLANACVRSLSVMENLALRRYNRPPMATGFLLHRGVMRRIADELIARYQIKTPSPFASIENLSGGNVQRVVLARELSEDVRLLVAQNPCFGLDAAAAAEIRGQLLAARDRGAAILLISEDLDEVLDLSDRILVISAGKIVYEIGRQEADRYEIGRHMTEAIQPHKLLSPMDGHYS